HTHSLSLSLSLSLTISLPLSLSLSIIVVCPLTCMHGGMCASRTHCPCPQGVTGRLCQYPVLNMSARGNQPPALLLPGGGSNRGVGGGGGGEVPSMNEPLGGRQMT